MIAANARQPKRLRAVATRMASATARDRTQAWISGDAETVAAVNDDAHELPLTFVEA